MANVRHTLQTWFYVIESGDQRVLRICGLFEWILDGMSLAVAVSTSPRAVGYIDAPAFHFEYDDRLTWVYEDEVRFAVSLPASPD